MKNQKEATVETIIAVLTERGYDYEMNGPTPISEVLTDADKASVRECLFTMFKDGSVSYKAEFQAKVDDDSELKKYISGLVNNWIRKHKGFNSGQAYVAKNPGSRQHVGDEQLRELKKLSTQYSDNPEALAEIAEAIATRTAELAAEKAKTVEINVNALPDSLKHLVN